MPCPAGNATSQPCRRRAFPKAIKALPAMEDLACGF